MAAASGSRPSRKKDRAFCAEAHRQSLAIATSAQEAEDQAFIDSVSDPDSRAALTEIIED